MRRTVTVESTGGSTTGVRLSPALLDELGAGKRSRLAVTFPNGHVLRTRTGSHDGDTFLPVSAATRDAAGVAAGEDVEVGIEVDTSPEVVEIPDDLAVALTDHPDARAFLDGLTASQQRGFATSVTSAKTPDTRARRVDKALQALLAGEKRP